LSIERFDGGEDMVDDDVIVDFSLLTTPQDGANKTQKRLISLSKL